MRILGLPVASPQAIAERTISDVGALARLALDAPGQLNRLMDLAEELLAVARSILELGERLDSRAASILAVGERLEGQAASLLTLGTRIETRGAELVDLGGRMENLGERVQVTGGEIVDRATRVSDVAAEVVGVLPALEKAIEMAIPLEGAIDRVGRFVDRLPGAGASPRRPGSAESQTR
jgi:hypothetical protein